MIQEKLNKGKNRKQASGSKSGQNLAQDVAKSAEQEARDLIQLRANAIVAFAASMVESGEYQKLVFEGLSEIFDGSRFAVSKQIEEIDEAFLLPPSS